MASLNYTYDVFFSYKRHDLTLHWTRQVSAQLRFWLTQELGYEASIFVDDLAIELGARWPDRLRQSLKESRCLVGVWSPLYFQSDWCVSEWRSFLERERLLGFNSYRLIAPLRFCDGEHFPEEAQKVQWHDVEAYNNTLPVFWKTERALALEDEIKIFAKKLAVMVRAAPPFDPTWPTCDEPGQTPPTIHLGRL